MLRLGAWLAARAAASTGLVPGHCARSMVTLVGSRRKANRFYKHVAVVQQGGANIITLDGRPLKTPKSLNTRTLLQ